MPSFNVSVVTQVKKILEQEAGYLRLRTSEGDIGILPNHAPFVAELSMGKMEIEKGPQVVIQRFLTANP